jgi:nucleoid DNA-binding protein
LNHRQTIAAVARRLPHRTKREVEEVLEVLTEVWSDALVNNKQEVTLRGLGKLVIEVQTVQGAGAVKGTVKRLYGRFRPAYELRLKVRSDG